MNESNSHTQKEDIFERLAKIAPEPAFEGGVTVVFASDGRYVPYLAVALTSLVANSSKDRCYDILILENGIGENARNNLKKIFAGRKNFCLRFISLFEEIKAFSFNIINYYSEAIYFRLFMPWFMKDYERAVYLDCDLIVLGDAAMLFDCPLEDNLLAAVPDIGMAMHFYTSGREYVPKSYFSDKLKGVRAEEYFNSGVLVFNLKKFRESVDLFRMIDEVNVEGLYYPDQDGLNILCRGKVKFLPFEWNCVPQNLGNRTLENMQSDLPQEIFAAYMHARSSPAIIHYAMKEKPWNYSPSLDFPLFIKFWKYALASPYRSDILLNTRMRISAGELAHILQLYGEGEIQKLKTWGNIVYACGGWCVGRLSAMPVKMQTCDVSKQGAVIDFTTYCFDAETADDIKFWFSGGGQKFYCEKLPRQQGITFGDEEISPEIVLRCSVEVREEPFELTLFCTYRGINVKCGRINFSKLFPVDKIIKHQYFYKDGIMLTAPRGRLRLERAGRARAALQELKFLRVLWKTGRKDYRKACLARLYAAAVNAVRKKPVWLIVDNFLSDDNGYAFFRYAHARRREVKTYFVCTEKSQNLGRIKSLGGKIVNIDSRKFKRLFLTSDFSIGSVVYKKMKNPFYGENDAYRDFCARRGFVFLQHGVINQDLSREHNKFEYNPAGFIVSAWPEYRSLTHGNYFYSKDEVWLTGLPRFDLLYRDEKKIITFMPTWRRYIGSELKKDSEFFMFYYGVLHDKRLQRARKKYGYTLDLRLHPLMQQFGQQFYDGEEDDCFEISEGSYRELFARSDLIITDYSSAVFDFIYMKKPIIYAHFDREKFFSGHVYQRGYLDYEKGGFGPVTRTVDELVDKIIAYMKRGCAAESIYLERMDGFFAHEDKENCARVYKKILLSPHGFK